MATREWGTPTSHHRTHTSRDVDHGQQLANQVEQWPTPRTRAAGEDDGPKGGRDLQTQARSWPTPTSMDSVGSGSKDYPATQSHHVGTTLTDAIREWPTPTADYKGPGGEGERDGGPTLFPTPTEPPDELPTPSDLPSNLWSCGEWLSPTSRDWKGPTNHTRHGAQLPDQVEALSRRSRPDQETETPGPESSPSGPTSLPLWPSGQWATPTCGDTGDKQTPASKMGLIRQVRKTGDALRLNPSFVDWLMGWPPGWTDATRSINGSW